MCPNPNNVCLAVVFRHIAYTPLMNHSFLHILLSHHSPMRFSFIVLFRTAGKDVKPSASTSAKTSQHRLHKTRHGSSSRSRSSSPRRPHGSEVRREKCSSRSRSSHSSRSNRRSVRQILICTITWIMDEQIPFTTRL